MLTIRRLSVTVAGKPIISGLSLFIEDGETVILFGPNGSGKTTLLKTLMGLKGYAATSGDMIFKGVRINDMPTDERVRLGLGVMYQHPPAIRGVTLRQIARYLTSDEKKIAELSGRLGLNDLLDREINLGFSGGEIKRAELFQTLLQDPALVLYDEPESGVDIENTALMGRVIRELLARPGKSALIITHTGYILDYVDAAKGCVMREGRSWCMNNPWVIFNDIRQKGYEKCVTCHERKTYY